VQYFPDQRISCTALSSTILPGGPPATVSQGDIEAALIRLHRQRALDGQDLESTIFNFILPGGSVLTDDPAPTGSLTGNLSSANGTSKSSKAMNKTASSLRGLGGYHGSIHPNRRTTLYYSVNVFSEILPNGKENGIAVFNRPWKNVVATLYHELNEFRTDPDVQDAINAKSDEEAMQFLGWTSRQGQEIGDFPIIAAAGNLKLVFKEVKATQKSFFLPIQFQYSNIAHGPEGPIKQPHK
jgi:hypothetical protein